MRLRKKGSGKLDLLLTSLGMNHVFTSFQHRSAGCSCRFGHSGTCCLRCSASRYREREGNEDANDAQNTAATRFFLLPPMLSLWDVLAGRSEASEVLTPVMADQSSLASIFWSNCSSVLV